MVGLSLYSYIESSGDVAALFHPKHVTMGRVEGPSAKKHKELNILLANKMHEGH